MNKITNFFHKIKNCLVKLYAIKPSNEEDVNNTFLCPKCQRGYLLEIPNEKSEYKYICEKCYLMVSIQELEKAIKNNYTDARSEEQKMFDAVLEQENQKKPCYRKMIKRGKRIVEGLKQHEKEKNNKSNII